MSILLFRYVRQKWRISVSYLCLVKFSALNQYVGRITWKPVSIGAGLTEAVHNIDRFGLLATIVVGLKLLKLNTPQNKIWDRSEKHVAILSSKGLDAGQTCISMLYVA
jgi:hypothetical protein